jgi:UDP-3-O-[3-hydroxymyristoyl] glucosamine N-acyltransferase
VLLGGQVGLADHTELGDEVRVAAQSGVHGRVPAGAGLLGTPAMPVETARRALAAVPRLPDLIRAVRALERRVVELEHRLGLADHSR